MCGWLAAGTLTNGSGQAIEGTLRGTIGDISFSKNVQVGPHTGTRVSLTPADFPQFVMARPQLWWPAGLGAQTLYRMQMEFETGGVVSDRASATESHAGNRYEVTCRVLSRKELLALPIPIEWLP